MSPHETADDLPRAGRREWIGLGLLALPAMLVSMDLTVLHLAVPALSAELRPTSAQLLWIVDIYGFMIAGFLVLMGTLGDRIGRRRLLLLGASGFGVASALAAFAPGPEALIAARALLGVCGATLAPSTVALIRHMFHDPAQRTRAISLWFMSFMAGSAIGPLIGGAMLEAFWWGAAFLIGVPVMLLLLVAGPALLPEYRDPTASGRLDLPSALVALAAVLSGMYGLKKAAESGPSAEAVAALALGVLGCLVFVRRQRTRPNPLIDLGLFASRTVRVALLALTVGAVAIGGIGYLSSQYLQLVLGLEPFEAGLWTLPPFVAGVATTVLAPALATRFRQGPVIAGGMASAGLGLAVLALAGGGGAGLRLVIGALVFLFGGLMPVLALGVDVVVGAAPPERTGAASAISETTQELGIALGIALLGSCATFVYRRGVDEVLSGSGVPSGAAEAARSTMGGAKGAADLPPDLLTAAGQAFTDGLRTAAGAGAALLIAGAVVAAAVLRRVPGPVADGTPEQSAAHP